MRPNQIIVKVQPKELSKILLKNWVGNILAITSKLGLMVILSIVFTLNFDFFFYFSFFIVFERQGLYIS